MNDLQAEHKAWLATMYPNQPTLIPAAGMVEEAGELLHAVLKMEQQKLWSAEARHGDLHSKLRDAIGDCGIYACSMCNACDWDFNKLYMEATKGNSTPIDSLLHLCVELKKHAAQSLPPAHSEDNMVDYLHLLSQIARSVNVQLGVTIRLTWLNVKQRNR